MNVLTIYTEQSFNTTEVYIDHTAINMSPLFALFALRDNSSIVFGYLFALSKKYFAQDIYMAMTLQEQGYADAIFFFEYYAKRKINMLIQ